MSPARHARRRVRRTGAAGVLIAATLAGCSASDAGTPSGFALGDGSYTAIAPDQRAPAAVLAGDRLGGGTLSSAEYPDKVLVVNVWGSWCAPCRHEAPELVSAAAQTAGTAQFLGINTRDLSPDPALAFERSFAVSYPSFYDPGGELLLGFGALPPKAIPSTVIIDRRGRVAARILGEATAGTLVQAVSDIAAGK